MNSRKTPTHGGCNTIYPRGPEDLFRTHPAAVDAGAVSTLSETLGALSRASVVPTVGSIETGAERADFCREAVALSTVPDPVRLCDAFPPSGRGTATPREHPQVVGLELSAIT